MMLILPILLRPPEMQLNASSLPLWSSPPFRSNQGGQEEKAQLTIRKGLAQRFATTTTKAQATVIAAPFLKSATDSRISAYKAMVALYFRTICLGEETGYSEARALWPVFCKLGDRSAPQHARIACDLAGLCGLSGVEAGTSRRVLKLYLDKADAVMLLSAAATATWNAHDIPSLEAIGDMGQARARTFPSTMVIDYIGKAPRARGVFLYSAGLCYERAAWTSENPRYGKKALKIYDEVAGDPAYPSDVRNQARSWRESLAKKRFMRGG